MAALATLTVGGKDITVQLSLQVVRAIRHLGPGLVGLALLPAIVAARCVHGNSVLVFTGKAAQLLTKEDAEMVR